ncbi:MAG: hypothetical protein ABGY08_10305 [Gammaproteobacteria bacterium]|jgi:hypothetical protein
MQQYQATGEKKIIGIGREAVGLKKTVRNFLSNLLFQKHLYLAKQFMRVLFETLLSEKILKKN